MPPAFFLPQFVPLLFLMFWVIRARLISWTPGGSVATITAGQ